MSERARSSVHGNGSNGKEKGNGERSKETMRDSKVEGSESKGRGHRDGESDGRRRRSRSRESMRDSKRRRRSRSRESARDSKTEGSFDRRARSRSRESVRDRDVEERRRERVSDDAHSRGRWNDVDGGRHEEIRDDKSKKGSRERHERRDRSRSRESVRERRAGSRESLREREKDRERRAGSRESLRERERRAGSRESGRERERRAGSRESLRDRDRRAGSRESLRERERRAGSRPPRGYGDDYSDRSARHGKNHYDALDGRNNNLHNASRDRAYGVDRHVDRDWDRSREGGYGNHHDRDRSDRGYQSRYSREEANHIKEEKETEEEDQEEYQERIESQLAAQEEDDVERIKEESRRRRQAILEKYKQQQKEEQQPEQQLEAPVEVVPTDNTVGNISEVKAEDNSPAPVNDSKELQAVEQTLNGMEVDLEKKNLVNGKSQNETVSGAGGLGQGSPKSEVEIGGDMFSDDIFGESPAGGRRIGKGDGITINTSGLNDNWDDPEGRYCFRIGEILDGRYDVLAAHGSGVFSTVVRAHDLKAGKNEPDEVAIKIIRNNDTMYKIGQIELVILNKLAGADPDNRRHCVRLLSSFEYRNHLCLVFESLHMNLREILKKYGRNVGINLTAVRAYAKQLFIALKHLRNCGVLHCDIKPDNMLVNDAMNVLKLCDFGSAMFAGENDLTPYLVSRFYRAPEIILGLPYDHALDVWSVGCCLYELYSGKMLFPGATNNDMLRLHMELKGSFPKKMLKKAQFKEQHFDQDLNFCAIEEDPVTKKMVKRIIRNDHFIKPKDMGSLISTSGTADEDPKLVAHFRDLLEKIFILDPDKRMTVSEALNHPFISGR
ncbi:hypothetical protein KC19_10G023100 [Ceratodon purpureus]|uniref:non-specific serine/threonine protein kinase n=1 Tax=Ceratodon purpureus TaxID=3225 RepID=A0A8T0GG18_CERPU|nr:hypothetical protein KC19_10G023100 [Ceratodon purpureus]